MFALTCNVKIGNKQLTAVNAVAIKRSVYTLGDTAVIKLPVTAVLRQQGQPAVSVETAREIKIGERVIIELGYDNRLQCEFVGYVKRINLRTPIEIECEDELYACRARNVRSSGTVTLEALLGKCSLVVGYAETLTLKNFAVPDKPVSSVLGKLSTDYGLSVFFDFEGRVYVCRPERVVGDTVNYKCRRNVLSDDDLQYCSREDMSIEIKAICITKDGTKIEAKKGVAGGVSQTRYFYDVESMQELAMLADQEIAREKSDSYVGSITTFLEPYAAPTMIANIVDPLYRERSGEYYIESVETTFGVSGARRKLEIGAKI